MFLFYGGLVGCPEMREVDLMVHKISSKLYKEENGCNKILRY